MTGLASAVSSGASRCLATLSLLALGCGDDASAATASDAGDAAPRVKERTVTIEVPQVVRREIVEAADGSFAYGAVTPLAGAEVCVKLRRDAFRSFERFEEIAPEDQICATSEEGVVVRLEGVPANSDLVITVEKEGFVPSSVTHRTDDRTLPLPSWAAGNVVTALVTPGVADPWLEPGSLGGADGATAVLQAPMSWQGPLGAAGPGAEQWTVPMAFPSVVLAEGALFEITTSDEQRVLDVTTQRERPSFVSLPAGEYRLRFGHPAARCEPLVFRFAWFPAGFPTGSADVIELPVLAGHTTIGAVDCFCGPRMPGEVPVDLATCAFGAADAGAP